MPAVCRYYLKGYCRYGNNCRFEHPGTQQETYSSSTNFSFKAALNEIGGSVGFSPINQQKPQSIFNTYQNNLGSTSGFSFTRTYEAIKSNSTTIDDVDMSADVINQPQQTNWFSTAYLPNRIDTSFNTFRPQFAPPNIEQPRQQQVTPANPNFTGLTELDEAELKAYQKGVFEFRNIPIKPPPQELCQT